MRVLVTCLRDLELVQPHLRGGLTFRAIGEIDYRIPYDTVVEVPSKLEETMKLLADRVPAPNHLFRVTIL